MIELKVIKYVSFIKKSFYQVILNEPHKIKSSKTKIDLTILMLDVIIRFFLNATSIINKFINLYNALVQLYFEK